MPGVEEFLVFVKLYTVCAVHNFFWVMKGSGHYESIACLDI